LDGLDLYNQTKSLGSMRAYKYNLNIESVHKNETTPLVEIVAYCLNPNHYHLLLREIHDSGISKFIQKLSTGYTKYFNEKYKRNGVLFQGKFKYVHIGTDEQLQYIGVYVNLNNLVHKITNNSKYKSSLENYKSTQKFPKCSHEVLASEYKSIENYELESKKMLPEIIRRKEEIKDLTKSEFIAD
jgi:REP element-mobilizing transposase RayT